MSEAQSFNGRLTFASGVAIANARELVALAKRDDPAVLVHSIRGLCPSCTTRRSVETAAHLVGWLPAVGYR